MDHLAWIHPFDARGRRVGFTKIPQSVSGLVDDPYRSLAGEVRQRGGFAKVDEPYVEFLWADFFSQRISSKVLAADFDAAVAEGLVLARSDAARHLREL